MVAYNRFRTQRRKKERDQVKQILESYAASVGMYIIDMVGVKPENLEAAALLLFDARDELPPGDSRAMIFSENKQAGIAFVFSNVPTCPHCGCRMCQK